MLMPEMPKQKCKPLNQIATGTWDCICSSVTEFSNDRASKHPQLIFSNALGFSGVVAKHLYFILQWKNRSKIPIISEELGTASNSQFPFPK